MRLHAVSRLVVSCKNVMPGTYLASDLVCPPILFPDSLCQALNCRQGITHKVSVSQSLSMTRLSNVVTPTVACTTRVVVEVLTAGLDRGSRKDKNKVSAEGSSLLLQTVV